MPSGSAPLDLVVTSLKQTAARCRVLQTAERVTLRATGLWRVVPGEIVTVQPRKRWTYAKHEYLSGEITAVRLDIPALGLTPLRLDAHGEWDPDEEYWCEPDEPIPEYARPIIERGPRPLYEMEQVLPGVDPDDLDDPIVESNDLKDRGDYVGAETLLMQFVSTRTRTLAIWFSIGVQRTRSSITRSACASASSH